MSRAPRRPRHNAGFQKKRPPVLALRPTSREIWDVRLQSLISSDPRREQQNAPVAAADVKLARASLLGEDESPKSAGRRWGSRAGRPGSRPLGPGSRGSRGRPDSKASSQLPPLAPRGPPYPGQARLGSAGNNRMPPKDRRITAQAWAIAGTAGNSLLRKKPEQVSLPPLSGHFPGVVDLMKNNKWRIANEPPGQQKNSHLTTPPKHWDGTQPTLPDAEDEELPQAAAAKPASLGRVVRAQRAGRRRSNEEHACRAPPNDLYDMAYREPLERWGYHKRKFCVVNIRLQPIPGEPECLQVHGASPSGTLRRSQVRFGPPAEAPWWAQHFKIETSDSANFSWLCWANAAAELAARLDKPIDAGPGRRGLARLYLDWVFCRLALPGGAGSRGSSPRSCSRGGPRKPRGRRPRSNPLRSRGRSLRRVSGTDARPPLASAPATLCGHLEGATAGAPQAPPAKRPGAETARPPGPPSAPGPAAPAPSEDPAPEAPAETSKGAPPPDG